MKNKIPESFRKPEILINPEKYESQEFAENINRPKEVLKQNKDALQNEALHEAMNLAEDSQSKYKEAPRHEYRQNHLKRSRAELRNSFNKNMSEARQNMNPVEATFSKIIHQPVIETVSDTLSKTIARPKSIMFGGLFAFIFTLVIYIYAKTYGFQLSGTETIIGFGFGWLFGIIVDYLKALFTGK